jgi:thioredoxin-related protein
MKAILSIISLSIFALFLQSYNTTSETNEKNGIQFFEGSFQDALELAKKENKLIFFDAYASWCGPCNRMKSKVFTQEEVGSYFNSRFINIKIDMEKGEGPSLAKKYRVTAYPTLLFIDHTGKLIHGAVGYHNPSSLIDLAKTANQ